MNYTQVETSISIPYSPRDVWDVLLDVGSYPNWNPFIRFVNGEIRQGQKISISLAIKKAEKLQTFKPTITRWESEKELRWVGHVLLPYIVFTGEHYFILKKESGATKFIHGEIFTGAIVPLIDVSQFVKKFDAMNVALAKEVDRRSA